jgi:hypothetical protein
VQRRCVPSRGGAVLAPKHEKHAGLSSEGLYKLLLQLKVKQSTHRVGWSSVRASLQLRESDDCDKLGKGVLVRRLRSVPANVAVIGGERGLDGVTCNNAVDGSESMQRPQQAQQDVLGQLAHVPAFIFITRFLNLYQHAFGGDLRIPGADLT